MDRSKFVWMCVACLGIAGTSLLCLTTGSVRAEQVTQEQRTQEERRPSTSERTDAKAKNLWNQIAQLHSQIVAIELDANKSRASRFDQAVTAVERTAQNDERQNQRRETVGGADTKTEQLWMQLARVHQQIVAQEAAGSERRTTFFRGEPQDRARLSEGRRADAVDERANASQGNPMDPLWERYVQIQREIVAADVRAAKNSSESLPNPTETDQK